MSVYARYKKQRKLRGCMRKLTFQPYQKVEGGKPPAIVRIWALLYQAVRNPQWPAGDDVLKVRATAHLLDKLESVEVTEQNERQQDTTRLKYEGGDVLLEDAEFAQLESAWKAFRPQLPASVAREIVLVTDFLNSAPTIEMKVVK